LGYSDTAPMTRDIRRMLAGILLLGMGGTTIAFS
jgi:hypothetical protein